MAGLWPFFYLSRSDFERISGEAVSLREKLIALAEPLLAQLGYELVELEHVPARSHALLRLYIDREGGVGIEDCERVSREISALFDVQDPLPGAYTLEVSSPGLDRVLRTPAHFARFIGAQARVELKVARDGRRRYTGRLDAVDDAGVRLDVDGTAVSLPYAEIGRARLVPVWEAPARLVGMHPKRK
jgi:ribosome maturation factor RimP